MWQDFKAFISRGNVVELAVGVIIGTSFTAIIKSLADDIFMPFVGILLGGIHIEGLAFNVGEASIAYGKFLMSVISFILIALILFFGIRAVAAANRELEEMGILEEEEEQEAAPPEPTAEEKLLTEIRDLLQANLSTEGKTQT